MRKNYKIVFVALIFILLLFPIVKFNFSGTVSALEKRNLATFPEFSLKYFKNLDSYIQDRFGGRDKLIQLANFIDYNVFHKSKHNAKVVEGKKGWLYYTNAADGNNLSDFMKTNLMSEEKSQALANKIRDIAAWCDENGIKYLFVINPNKHSVYPEYYPIERPEGLSRSDQNVAVFSQAGVNFIFTKDLLLERKKNENLPLYYETDSHWNRLGAYYAYLGIKTEIEKLFPDLTFPSFDCDVNVSYRYDYNDSPNDHYGDLLPFLGISSMKCTYPVVTPKTGAFEDCFDYIKNEDTAGVITKGKNPSLPKAVIYRDSFCRNLMPYLSTMFSDTEYIWKKIDDFDKDYILKSKPDIIIFEALERMLI